MDNYKIGDYIISKDNHIYKILETDISQSWPHDQIYTLIGLTKKKNFYGIYAYERFSGLNSLEISEMGELVPLEQASDMFKLLYEK